LMLDCDAPGQRQVWGLCARLWAYKYGYSDWPRLSWGLILGCNLIKFKPMNGKIMPNKQRLFAILVSTSLHLIWRLRNERRFDNNNKIHTHTEIPNHWLAVINITLKRDRLLTNKIHF
ncbi:hypothetical protein B0H19DRAFT_870283, partial [Mycena capillaripes]